MKELNEEQVDSLMAAMLEELTVMLGNKYTVTIILSDESQQDIFSNDMNLDNLISGMAEEIKDRQETRVVRNRLRH